MAQKYKIKSSLKNLPFYSQEIKSSKKQNKTFSNFKFLSELPFFCKEPKELTNKNYQKCYHFHQKEKEDLKD